MAKKRKIDFSQEPPSSISEYQFYGYTLDDDQMAFADAIYSDDNDIIFCNAPAGTGKNLIAIGTANILVQFGKFDEIVYIVSPYGERKQGYLPGDIQTKSSVYYDPLYQAVVSCGINPHTSVNLDGIDKCGGYITCITDTYLRGVNLNNRKVVILDECQNYSVSQLKKTLTRIGSDAKTIVIGHDKQCDLEDPSTSGFTRYIEHFRGKPRCAVCELHTNHRGWVSQWADELQE